METRIPHRREEVGSRFLHFRWHTKGQQKIFQIYIIPGSMPFGDLAISLVNREPFRSPEEGCFDYSDSHSDWYRFWEHSRICPEFTYIG